MLSFDRLCKQNKKFSRLTGVTVDEFREIVRKVAPKWEAFQERKKLSGRCSKLETLEDEGSLVLIYYRFIERMPPYSKVGTDVGKQHKNQEKQDVRSDGAGNNYHRCH